MISISKLEQSKTKFVNINSTPALNQGIKFKKYQNKIHNQNQNNLEQKYNMKEGFNNIDSDKNVLTNETNKIIDDNSFLEQDTTLNNLKNEYENSLTEYKNLLEQMKGTTSNFFNRVSSNNPFIGKNIGFSNGRKYYVTKQGVAKWIPNRDIWNSLNIPKEYINIDIPWLNDYNIQGTQIPTNPPLIVGTPLKYGQSIGNEGSNVFVNQLIPSDISPSYMGCYASSPNNDNMLFIGNNPSSNNISIQNGNFSQPKLSNNSFKYITSNSEVPGWEFKGSVLANNSKSWGYPIPYPNGPQCVSLQNSSYISQLVKLIVNTTYTLIFSACGRGCCTKPNTSNPIKIELYDINNNVISKIYQTTPPVNKWTTYTTTFTVPTTQSFNLRFSGTNTTGDRSSGIQDIILNSNYSGSGDFTYDACKIAAVNNGYQYFSLQNVNINTSKGYCAVSNSSPSISQYGESLIPNKIIILWQTNTLGTGNIATLNKTGSLNVIDSTGSATYSTPSSNANPSNYYGCYGDNKDRAMNLHNRGSQKYTNDECQKIAKKNGRKYYGLQNSTSGKNAQCVLSDDLSKAMKYGKATNCTKLSDGSYSGGGWSNAIYNTQLPESNYFLILQDDGNMCVYRGRGPNDNQGIIWATMTNGKQQSSNPDMVSSKNKYGKNWVSNNYLTLAPGDFISSTKGDLVLMMQPDGNLVLYTYSMDLNCKKMNDGNMGGGINANAAYDIGQKSITKNMGLLGLIDEDSNLYTYPSDNQMLQNSYSEIKGIDTPENDIPGAAFTNATFETCKSACNKISDCAGFILNVDNTYNKGCWPKKKSMYPFGGKSNPNSSLNLYIRNKEPSSPPTGVSKNTNNIDSITFENYSKNEQFENKYGLSNITETQKQQIIQMETKLNLLTKQINDYTNKYENNSSIAQDQSFTNISGINQNLQDLNKTNVKIVKENKSNGLNNILKDSDIIVLQKNYDYLFWSILAVGTVLVSMNIVKK